MRLNGGSLDEVALEERGLVLGAALGDLDVAHALHHAAEVRTIVERAPVAAHAAREVARATDVEWSRPRVAEAVHARPTRQRAKRLRQVSDPFRYTFT